MHNVDNVHNTLTRALLGIQLLLLAQEFARQAKRRRIRRRWWVRPIDRPRSEKSFFLKVMDAKATDHEKFYLYTRCLPYQFDMLVELLRPYFPEGRSIRPPIPVEFRLASALIFLAHGTAPQLHAAQFYFGSSTAYKHIPETCNAIWDVLQPRYLPRLNRARWKAVAEGFMERWQFPNCLGALDGKHVKIKCPIRTCSQYYGFKGYFSLVLMATCDAAYRFTWVDIGQYGSISDCGVWNNTPLARDLELGTADIPPPRRLPNSDILVPFALVGDEAFPLKNYIMRPYKAASLNDEKRIFNYRLSRARRVIENAFGILASRWQILFKTINASPDGVTAFVKAMVCLHNFLTPEPDELDRPLGRYFVPDLVDREDAGSFTPGTWHTEAKGTRLRDIRQAVLSYNHSVEAGVQQDVLKDYFLSSVGEAQVPWQRDSALQGSKVQTGNGRVMEARQWV